MTARRYLVSASFYLHAESEEEARNSFAVTSLTCADGYGDVLDLDAGPITVVLAPITASWAPESVRAAFAAAEIADGRILTIAGRIWATNGHVAIDAGPAAVGAADSPKVERFAASLLAPPSHRATRADTADGKVRFGSCLLQARYVDAVELAHPGCEWRANVRDQAAMAIDATGRVVGAVMPLVDREPGPVVRAAGGPDSIVAGAEHVGRRQATSGRGGAL